MRVPALSAFLVVTALSPVAAALAGTPFGARVSLNGTGIGDEVAPGKYVTKNRAMIGCVTATGFQSPGVIVPDGQTSGDASALLPLGSMVVLMESSRVENGTGRDRGIFEIYAAPGIGTKLCASGGTEAANTPGQLSGRFTGELLSVVPFLRARFRSGRAIGTFAGVHARGETILVGFQLPLVFGPNQDITVEFSGDYDVDS